jgi:glycosyltransferase involved in cell wall biosynthesis
MRLIWYSASLYARTGYGTQSKEIVFRLVDEGYDIISVGDVSSGGYVWGGQLLLQTYKGKTVPCYPCTQAALGEFISYYVKKFKPDLLVAFYDPFPHLNALKSIDVPQLFYIPIDGPTTEKTVAPISHGYRIVTYSRFGYREMLKWFSPARVNYIPHGIDCSTYKPLSEKEKEKAREMLGMPNEAVVFLNVAANLGPRKHLPHLLLAFSKLAKKYGDVYLYMYTNPSDWPRGYDLSFLARQFGVEDRVILPQSNPLIDPLEDEEMALLFGAADWYCSTASAEGFCIPLLQSIACGVPAIGVRNSAQTELVEGNGLLVEPSKDYLEFPLYVPYMTHYYPPSLESLYNTLEQAYKIVKEQEEQYEELSKKARKKALRYDWSKIIPKWKQLLDEVYEETQMLKNLS